MTPYREREFSPEPRRPRSWRRRLAPLVHCAFALLTLWQLKRSPPARPSTPPAVEARAPRRVAQLSEGHERVLVAATDGTTWSVPERGVVVNGERRRLTVRERFTGVASVVETEDRTVFTLGLDGSVRRHRAANGEGEVVFADVGRVAEMEMLRPAATSGEAH